MSTYYSPAITPVITAGAYSQNDSVGGVFSVRLPMEQGTLMSVTILDDGDQGSALELWLFEEDITGVADNAAFALTDADMGKCVGVVALDTWFDADANQICVVDNIGMVFRSLSGTLTLMLKMTDASTPTYAATDDLHIRLGIVY